MKFWHKYTHAVITKVKNMSKFITSKSFLVLFCNSFLSPVFIPPPYLQFGDGLTSLDISLQSLESYINWIIEYGPFFIWPGSRFLGKVNSTQLSTHRSEILIVSHLNFKNCQSNWNIKEWNTGVKSRKQKFHKKWTK